MAIIVFCFQLAFVIMYIWLDQLIEIEHTSKVQLM